MSYRDPYYSSQPAQHYQGQQPYSDAQDYDSYNNRQQHPTYDQSGYTDEDGFPSNTLTEHDGAATNRDKSRYEEAGFPPALRPPASTGAMRLWRKDNRGQLWTKGGRGKCILRFCCCTFLITIFLIISIVLSLGIWIRPPDITVNEVGFDASNGSAFAVSSSTLNVYLAVNISVANPNYFSVKFKDIKLALTYPIDNLNVGGGEKDNIEFKSHTQTVFDFPFALAYNVTNDTNDVVLKDLLSKCGITGSKENIVVDYKITLGLKIVFVTISPSFSNTFSFECPVTASDLASLLKGAGIDISSLTGRSSS